MLAIWVSFGEMQVWWRVADDSRATVLSAVGGQINNFQHRRDARYEDSNRSTVFVAILHVAGFCWY